MILDIIQHPDAGLGEVAEEAVVDDGVTFVEREDELSGTVGPMESLLVDMTHTMLAANGAGLAAPQVGHNVRAIVVKYIERGNTKVHALLNPKIISRGNSRTNDFEGCLSVDEGRSSVRVRRAFSVVVEGLSPRGVKLRIGAKAFLASVLQHEIDHLDGITIADKTPPRRKRHLALAHSAGG